MATHYVNNADLLKALKEYREKVQASKLDGTPKPRVPEYIGECILKIATHLSFKPNFINYTYREEMVSDAYENCLTYIDNFDPAKSSNPFSYLTQISWYAFLRRIKKEKDQTLIKAKILMEIPYELLDMQEHDAGSADGFLEDTRNNYLATTHSFRDALEREQERVEKKKAKKTKQQATLEDLIEAGEIPEED